MLSFLKKNVEKDLFVHYAVRMFTTLVAWKLKWDCLFVKPTQETQSFMGLLIAWDVRSILQWGNSNGRKTVKLSVHRVGKRK